MIYKLHPTEIFHSFILMQFGAFKISLKIQHKIYQLVICFSIKVLSLNIIKNTSKHFTHMALVSKNLGISLPWILGA